MFVQEACLITFLALCVKINFSVVYYFDVTYKVLNDGNKTKLCRKSRDLKCY